MKDQPLNNLIQWNIAGFDSHDRIIDTIYDKNKIKYVFGGIGSPLSGGRFHKKSFDEDYFRYRVSILNYYGIGVRLTLQSLKIHDNFLQDINTNKALSFVDYRHKNFGAKNGVIVASDKLRDFIRDKYNNLYIISSIIRVANDTNFISDDLNYYQNLLNNYDFVVLNTGRIFDYDFLTSLPNKNKIEIIVNSKCLKNCPFAKIHYQAVENINQDIDVRQNLDICNQLKEKCSALLEDKQYNLIQTKDDLIKLQELGFYNFKLEGRDFTDEEYLKDIQYYLY